MAEITTQTTDNKNQKRINKKSTKVDLTPMVDLGFLLITFFVFTTSMTVPTSMKVIVPKNSNIDNLPVPESSVLTVILDDASKVYYYEGSFTKDKNLLQTTNDADGIRNILVDKKRRVAQQALHNKLSLIIKCANTANYKNVVDMLDEVTISQVPIYFIDKLTDEEKELIETKLIR